MINQHSTNSTMVAKPLDWDSIADTHERLLNDFKDIPTKFICATNVYAALLREVKHIKPKTKVDWTIFGIDVEVDEDMKPGEWKFEYRNENRTN